MTRGQFTAEQVERLLRPIKPGRVYQNQGQSHVAGWEISAHLTRMFGFGGWEKQILELTLVAEEHAPEWNEKRNWFVTYRCHLRLRVFDPEGRLAFVTDDVGSGTSPNLPGRGEAHDFAMKNAVTYALKRCAKDLGDQFGLSLYDKGRVGAVVGMTLVNADEGVEPDIQVEGEGDDHEPVVEAPEAPANVDTATGEVAERPAESAALQAAKAVAHKLGDAAGTVVPSIVEEVTGRKAKLADLSDEDLVAVTAELVKTVEAAA